MLGDLTFALVGRDGGQGVSVKACLAAVAEEAVGVVDAFETLAGLAVTVPHSVGVDVVAALAGAACSHRTVVAQGVSEETIVTQLTALACEAGRDWNSVR